MESWTIKKLKTREFYVLLHLVAFIYAAIGYISFEVFSIAAFFSTMLWIFGVAISTHRYLSHNTFTCSVIWDRILKISSLLAVNNSPSHWVAMHRQHHTYSDSDKDPHSPYRNGFFRNALHFYKPFILEDQFTNKHNDKFLLFLDTHPLKIILVYVVILWLIDPIAVFIFYIFPSLWVFWMTSLMVNSGAHYDLFGYRNFNTSDHSRNVAWAWPLLFGESYHNNHHHHSWSYNQAVTTWEWDLEAFIIKHIIKGKNLRDYNKE